VTRSIARFRPYRAPFKGLMGRSFAGASIMAIRGRMTLGVGSVTATAHVTQPLQQQYTTRITTSNIVSGSFQI
jgi:hypothetical protein